VKSGRILHIIYFIFLTTLVISFASCDKYRFYEKNKEIKDGVWNRSEVIRFEVPVNDTLFRYNFFVNIRNSTDYGFANLFLFLNTIYPDHKISRDTLECLLADREGKWYGHGMGDIKTCRIMIKKGLRFPQKGLYAFEFEQGMRVENLKGIHDIGLRIEKVH